MILFSVFNSYNNEQVNMQQYRNTRSYLQTKGIPFREFQGMYEGVAELSFGISDEYRDVAEFIADIYNQESILYIDGDNRAFLTFSNDSTELIGVFQPVDTSELQSLRAYSIDLRSKKAYAVK